MSTAPKMHELLGTDLVTVPCGEHGLLIGFLNSNVGKLQLKFVTIQVVHPQFAQKKTQRLARLLTKTEEVRFLISLVRPLIWNTYVNFWEDLNL